MMHDALFLALAVAPAFWCTYEALVAYYAEQCRIATELMLDNDPVLYFRGVP